MSGFKSPLFPLGISEQPPTYGKGAGPLPFTIGIIREPVEPDNPTVYGSSGGYRDDYWRVKDDNELIEIIIMLAEAGVFD